VLSGKFVHIPDPIPGNDYPVVSLLPGPVGLVFQVVEAHNDGYR
jgi:hypothetical protein